MRRESKKGKKGKKGKKAESFAFFALFAFLFPPRLPTVRPRFEMCPDIR